MFGVYLLTCCFRSLISNIIQIFLADQKPLSLWNGLCWKKLSQELTFAVYIQFIFLVNGVGWTWKCLLYRAWNIIIGGFHSFLNRDTKLVERGWGQFIFIYMFDSACCRIQSVKIIQSFVLVEFCINFAMRLPRLFQLLCLRFIKWSTCIYWNRWDIARGLVPGLSWANLKLWNPEHVTL